MPITLRLRNLSLAHLTRYSYLFIFIVSLAVVSVNYYVLSSLKKHISGMGRLTVTLLANIEQARYMVVNNQRVAMQSILYRDETMLFEVAGQATTFYKMMNDIMTDLDNLYFDRHDEAGKALAVEISGYVNKVGLAYREYLRQMLSRTATLIESGVHDRAQIDQLTEYQVLFNNRINEVAEKINGIVDTNVKMVKHHADFSIRIFASFSVLLVLMSALVIYWNNRYFIRPLRRVSSFVDEYRFDKPVKIQSPLFEGKNEIGGLCKNISNMLNNLHTVTVSRDRLEGVVKELEQANAVKSEFLSSMSHEFRTPLNAIIGFSDLLKSTGKSDDHSKFLTGIKQAGLDILEMTEKLLDAGRLQDSRVEFNIESIDVTNKIEEAMLMVRPMAIANSISLSFEHSKENVYVETDAFSLKHSIINLLSNAIKYNRVGGNVRVNITAEVDDRIRINVKDTGPGISEANQAKLFEAFQRLDFTNSNIRGAGIGLHITRNRIERLGGKVGFYSKPGQGCHFWIELVRSRPAEALLKSG